MGLIQKRHSEPGTCKSEILIDYPSMLHLEMNQSFHSQIYIQFQILLSFKGQLGAILIQPVMLKEA